MAVLPKICSDKDSRERALSVYESFIVQAPAGSGKTELLTQRFLTLLTTVANPEHIIALTFTKKAANEMRARLIDTLIAAQEEASAQNLRPETLQQALLVLKCDKDLNWNLLKNTHRLKVMTIDSLCHWLVHAMPLQSILPLDAKISLFPERLYFKAAQECFANCLTDTQLQYHLKVLLQHLDNDQEKLLNLWVDLLKTRDQWLSLVYSSTNTPKLKMEEVIKELERQVLNQLINSLSVYELQDLHQFYQELNAYGHLPEWGSCLSSWLQAEHINLLQAKALSKILLTNQLTFRKRADHHIGLKKEKSKEELFVSLKSFSEDLFLQLSLNEDFYNALIHIHHLPLSFYAYEKWEVLQSLLTLLVQLVAHLKVVFAESRCVDFSEVAEAALSALGEDLNPTDLNLYLDYSIKHLLIDEFQDTSYSQFQLISRLIAGWEESDGRTLFIVGDPMQSIYRFRQAEVGLFLQVREYGIGALKLIPLYLTSNFRSYKTLIDWVNYYLNNMFPKKENIQLGAVTFHPASCVNIKEGLVEAFATESKQAEADLLARLVAQHIEQSKDETIAILVRSRSHLERIIPVLKTHNIAFEGVELVSLKDQVAVRDLYSLTQALLMPAAKMPWFSVLRSPYVGLILEDLLIVARVVQDNLIHIRFDECIKHPRLSEDGKKRLSFAKQVFEAAYQIQDQLTVNDWILKIHLDLLGNNTLSHETWLSINAYFELLENFVENNSIQDWELFEKNFSKLHANQASEAKVKIMTIHQAKGLEFDTVILPSLGRSIKRTTHTLLRWIEIISSKGEKECVLSPLKAAEEDRDALYEYLGYLEQEKEKYERQRLFYVALTRAKKHLYLLDSKEKPDVASFRSDLDADIFSSSRFSPGPTNTNEYDLVLSKAENHALCEGSGSSANSVNCNLQRIPLEIYINKPLDLISLEQELPVLNFDSQAKHIGIILHKWIKWICEKQVKAIEDMPWQQITKEYMQTLGVDDKSDLQKILTITKKMLLALFKTKRGRWLIANHEDANNEFAFLVKRKEKEAATYVVDRIFLRSYKKCKKRWIIDFKTGFDDDNSSAKSMQHQEQVNRYAYYLGKYYTEPIMCGVFYLSSKRWVEWDPITTRNLQIPVFEEEFVAS